MFSRHVAAATLSIGLGACALEDASDAPDAAPGPEPVALAAPGESTGALSPFIECLMRCYERTESVYYACAGDQDLHNTKCYQKAYRYYVSCGHACDISYSRIETPLELPPPIDW
jgi:hypothetical protein